MMTVPMDSSASESRELAQRLFTKNIELQNGLRKSAQSKVPSDPNAWNQMRENYEAIVLKDHEFSEKHEVEYALWQLHYRRIEEFRAHINGAISAGGSVTATSGGKGTARPERIKKILSVFKSFLSEATGFYHDLLLKIKAKYGLPLVSISESPENGVVLAKDENKSSEMKKGLLSCHRCLIYLGDLSRYKGLYGEADSSRDFAAASSYYVQAASLWPSNGNPHHQLAILASYSGDELVVVYSYFRSLAVNTPFSTARDNLIIAFEKNRQSYSQLPGNAKVSPATKVLPTRMNGGRGRGRGRGDTRLLTKDTKTDFTPAKGRELSVPETFKTFSTRFVRLNGILFTRTSLETFDEVLSLVLNILRDLLSSGPKEELNFGQDATENGLVFVRFIAILIFSVHNVYKESEGQSYAEILQRAVVLQNAFSAAFEFVGYILKRCIELDDVASSYLLPAILVFMEWLACHPDIANRNDVEEKEAGARSFFWKQCVSLINILMGSELVSIGGNDDTSCFSDMSTYDEGETGNRLALWEDIELRGFSPLVPAHLILDFSKKHPLGNDGSNEENKARVSRILAAGKTLVHEVVIDHQGVYYDCSLKRFVIGTKPATYDDFAHEAFDLSKPSDVKQTSPGGKTGIAQSNKMNLEGTQPKEQVFAEGEEDDEEIVFQPSVAEKYPSLGVAKSNQYDSIHPVQHYSGGDLLSYADSFSVALENLRLPSAHKASPQLQAAVPSVSLPPLENMVLRNSNYFIEQELPVANGLRNMNITGNGFCGNPVVQERPNGLQHTAPLSFPCTTDNSKPNITMPYQHNVAESAIPSKLDSIVSSGSNYADLSMKSSVPFPATSRKNPVSRPVRHLGPPPGFGNGPSKKMESFSKPVLNGQLPPMDDYRWLDGYQTPSTKGNGFDNFQNHNSYMHQQFATSNSNGFNDALSFPFPGKQTPMVQADATNVKKWQEFQPPENLKVYSEQQLPRGNQQPAPLPEQYQAQSLWSSQYFV